MALPGSLQLSHGLGLCRNLSSNKDMRVKGRCKLQLFDACPSYPVSFMKHDYRGLQHLRHINRSTHRLSCKSRSFKCHCVLVPGQHIDLPAVKVATTVLTRCCNVLQNSPVVVQLIPAVGIIIFALWGVGPLMFQTRKLFFQRSDNSWKKSTTHYIVTSYLRPLLLWTGAILICRAFEPVILPTETSQAVKERLLSFVKSLSTVVAFAYCLSSVIQQAQKFVTENADTSDTRNMGFQFAGKAVYSAVWIAAFSLFMELLGFSTQKWVTAGGFGTVLLTLAGREIFTNFLSSAMIHATRPFVVNEWIQTKIEGYEVSGTVEHVGWWSPTIIRGEDREAVHIPNHKFTVNVVRNLTQKTHWRIKTHLAISHLDVNKINIIVADMRKVLAKNPQVEQQRLHRRVFLDNINPENQALMILISCFVKTSHFEEYLCVKETILLDLLRVISHHRARLATPVRTIQKIYSDADLDNIPYADSTFNGAGAGTVTNRPLLVIESPYKNSADDKTKSRPARATVDQDIKIAVKTKLDTKTDDKVGPIGAPDTKVRGTQDDSEVDAKVMASNSDANGNSKPDSEVSENKPLKSNVNKVNVEVPTMSSNSTSKVTGSEVDNSTQKDIHVKQSKGQTIKNIKPNLDSDNLVSSSSNNTDKANGNTPTKQQGERKPATSRPILEENIVLGVALEGSKRTLPIDDEGNDPVATQEAKEMASHQGGNGSPKASDGNVK